MTDSTDASGKNRPVDTGEDAASLPVVAMFGQTDDVLLDYLETLRQRLCTYWTPNPTDRCDCKFGATGKGEATGCPEVRQAIAIISGQREQVTVLEKALEASALNTLREMRRVFDRFDIEAPSDIGRTSTAPNGSKGARA